MRIKVVHPRDRFGPAYEAIARMLCVEENLDPDSMHRGVTGRFRKLWEFRALHEVPPFIERLEQAGFTLYQGRMYPESALKEVAKAADTAAIELGLDSVAREHIIMHTTAAVARLQSGAHDV